MPGLRKVLPALKKAGLLLGIVSNAQFFTPLVLAAFAETGWSRGLFNKSLCAWSYQYGEAKPSSSRMLAALLHRLSHRYGIQASETLIIGNDLRNDILPASQWGCATALFAGDARSLRWRRGDPDCRGIMPDLVLTQMIQLLTAIGVAPQKTSILS